LLNRFCPGSSGGGVEMNDHSQARCLQSRFRVPVMRYGLWEAESTPVFGTITAYV